MIWLAVGVLALLVVACIVALVWLADESVRLRKLADEAAADASAAWTATKAIGVTLRSYSVTLAKLRSDVDKIKVAKKRGVRASGNKPKPSRSRKP